MRFALGSLTALLLMGCQCSSTSLVTPLPEVHGEALREGRSFIQRLLPPAWHAKHSDTDLSMPSFVICLVCSRLAPYPILSFRALPTPWDSKDVCTPCNDQLSCPQSIWLLVLFSFPSLPEGTGRISGIQRFGTSRFDSTTIGALFFTIGVMISDRIIYRLWAPPTAITPALHAGFDPVSPRFTHPASPSHGAAGSAPSVQEDCGRKQRRGSDPLTDPANPTSIATRLKLLLHVVVTGVVHGTSFFAVKLWHCSGAESDCDGGLETGGKSCGGCEPSLIVRTFYVLASLYLFLSASQLRLGFPLAPRDHPLTESGEASLFHFRMQSYPYSEGEHPVTKQCVELRNPSLPPTHLQDCCTSCKFTALSFKYHFFGRSVPFLTGPSLTRHSRCDATPPFKASHA